MKKSDDSALGLLQDLQEIFKSGSRQVRARLYQQWKACPCPTHKYAQIWNYASSCSIKNTFEASCSDCSNILPVEKWAHLKRHLDKCLVHAWEESIVLVLIMNWREELEMAVSLLGKRLVFRAWMLDYFQFYAQGCLTTMNFSVWRRKYKWNPSHFIRQREPVCGGKESFPSFLCQAAGRENWLDFEQLII